MVGLNEAGPSFGYFPKPSKTLLIVKDASLLVQAREIFSNTGIKISSDGERHLGDVVGSSEYRDEYINSKIEKWIKDIEQLSYIAKDEPQLALSAFNKALSMRWCFIQRTIKTADREYETSVAVTRNLSQLIQNQEQNLNNYDINQIKNEINKAKAEKEKSMKEEYEEV